MASKIHIFKKSAIEAGTPEKYYLNASENLMKITSAWRVVEHEDLLALTFHLPSFGELVSITPEGKFMNIEVEKENKEKAARVYHKDGMKHFCIEMNPNFLKLGLTGDDITSDGTARMYLKKLTPEEIKNNSGPKINASYLNPGENKNKGPCTITISRVNY